MPRRLPEFGGILTLKSSTDVIVLTRLTNDLKAASDPTGSKAPSIRLTEAGSSNSSPVDPPTPVTDEIVELNKRLGCMNAWRKDLERSVFWHREEFRRIERALGRKKSGQSGAVQPPPPPPARNVGFAGNALAGGDEQDDGVDTENREYLAGLEAKLQEGMSLQEAAEEQKVLREQDYARDRWSSSLSRLPSQTEWEDLVGPKVSGLFPVIGSADGGDADSPEEVARRLLGYEAEFGCHRRQGRIAVFFLRDLMCRGVLVDNGDCHFSFACSDQSER